LDIVRQGVAAGPDWETFRQNLTPAEKLRLVMTQIDDTSMLHVQNNLPLVSKKIREYSAGAGSFVRDEATRSDNMCWAHPETKAVGRRNWDVFVDKEFLGSQQHSVDSALYHELFGHIIPELEGAGVQTEEQAVHATDEYIKRVSGSPRAP
jgi:hypothetical protein